MMLLLDASFLIPLKIGPVLAIVSSLNFWSKLGQLISLTVYVGICNAGGTNVPKWPLWSWILHFTVNDPVVLNDFCGLGYSKWSYSLGYFISPFVVHYFQFFVDFRWYNNSSSWLIRIIKSVLKLEHANTSSWIYIFINLEFSSTWGDVCEVVDSNLLVAVHIIISYSCLKGEIVT